MRLAGFARELHDKARVGTKFTAFRGQCLNPQSSLFVVFLLIPHAGLGVLIHTKYF